MDQITLAPIAAVNGDVTLPGSKSLSNRLLLLAAMARGTTRITNLLFSDDTERMLDALKSLGIAVTPDRAQSTCVVVGVAGPLAQRLPTDAVLSMHIGNAGTAMRPLCAALCIGSGTFELTGVPRMYERPIGDLVDALQQLGADISYLGEAGFPPVRITASRLRGNHVRIRGNMSSQFLTALLLAAPLTGNPLTIEVEGELVSKPYIDITLDVMRRFGVTVQNRDYQELHVPGSQTYLSPGDIMVEGDASSASYFLAAAAIRGGTVRVHGVGRNSVQGDKAFADVLGQMGARVEWGEDWVAVTRDQLNGLDIDLNAIPDAAMTLATTALFAQGPTTIRNVYNWRLKETDRLHAMTTELKKLGARVEEGEDWLRVWPQDSLKPAVIHTYDDHRMAMCFALAALGNTPITIQDPGCTAKTFPDFFARFDTIIARRTSPNPTSIKQENAP